jgi:hypothetical protein
MDPVLPLTTLSTQTHPVNDLVMVVMVILKMDKLRDIQSHAFLRYGNIKF